MIPPPPFLEIPYRYAEGHAQIAANEIRFEDQIYSHQSGDEHWHWYVGKIYKMIAAGEVRPQALIVGLDVVQLQFILDNRGIEEWHLSRINPAGLRSPGILIALPDDTDILADGAHRYVRRWREGLRDMRFFRITEEQARPAVLAVDEPLLEYVAKVKALHETIHRATRGALRPG